MQALGSSLELKREWGMGYHCTCVKASVGDFRIEPLANLFESAVPGAALLTNVGAEVRQSVNFFIFFFIFAFLYLYLY